MKRTLATYRGLLHASAIDPDIQRVKEIISEMKNNDIPPTFEDYCYVLAAHSVQGDHHLTHFIIESLQNSRIIPPVNWAGTPVPNNKKQKKNSKTRRNQENVLLARAFSQWSSVLLFHGKLSEAADVRSIMDKLNVRWSKETVRMYLKELVQARNWEGLEEVVDHAKIPELCDFVRMDAVKGLAESGASRERVEALYVHLSTEKRNGNCFQAELGWIAALGYFGDVAGALEFIREGEEGQRLKGGYPVKVLAHAVLEHHPERIVEVFEYIREEQLRKGKGGSISMSNFENLMADVEFCDPSLLNTRGFPEVVESIASSLMKDTGTGTDNDTGGWD